MADGKKPRASTRNKGIRDNLYFDKKRGKWYVRIWVNGREKRRLGGTSKSAAQLVLADLRRAKERDRLDLPRMTTATLADFAPHYMKWAKAHKRSWERDEYSLKQLLPRLGHLRLTEINKNRVEGYMQDRFGPAKGPTINREVACLRKLMTKAVEHGLLEVNPLFKIQMFDESPGRMPSLELEDEAKLIEACRPWLRFLVRLAITTGCRQRELLALRWRHINFDDGFLVVEDSKGKVSRTVPLHPMMVVALRERRGLPEGIVITHSRGRSPSRYTVSDAFKIAAKKIGRPELRYHDLRHIFGTRFHAQEASLIEIAAVMGHKTLEMARRYSHISPNRLQTLVSKMPVSS